MWRLALRPALLILAFLVGLAAHAALAGGDPSLALADQVPSVERAREHEWHKLYEAAGMSGDPDLQRLVYARLACMKSDGRAEARLAEPATVEAVCEERGGGTYPADGTFDRFAREHLEWSLKNLSFVREVSTAERARNYMNSHR
jgi:hypothetical protein